ncbi:phospholipase effector Tle1 domain-containing protein [Actinomycetospora sp. TBRC 11914]|uniref:phospholipase effector Tle1 domain-containing protein n=1 Tax=Actinomycetospora sp. TBRC 11914 TaxID=2729387 RepID=UPI00145E5586|nr:DUF2235 domain-containing protein [Actinomycetospora sp. TBRC 11914]NMO92509.1 DUF2235 domain-containing protein [Actinomycetospora sp. TBRC 11914]
MRRLVVCCDGTWETPKQRTNVSLVADALAQGPDQVVRYFPGVGTGADPVTRVLEGGLGLGLDVRIREAYTWLAETWRPGDVVVLLGFSRGAFTVRSLAGMLAACGLVAVAPGDSRRARDRLVRRVFRDGYQRGRPLDGLAFQPGFAPEDTAPIALVGVWDTVGALGIPRTFGLLSALLSRRIEGFHDLRLARDVRHARQALALDERRGPFQPAVWAEPAPGTHESFVQLWFAGTHGDVGGSQDQPRGLSDLTLRWMTEEATAAVGLTWRDGPPGGAGDPLGHLDPGPDGMWRYLAPRPRTVPRVAEGAPDVHPSAVARRAAGLVPPYRPGRVPEPGVPVDAVVAADAPWVETGLYLPAGRYTLTTAGSWSDHGASTGPAGFARWPWRAWPDYALGAVLAVYRRVVRRCTSRSADALAAPRRDTRRMALVAAVADDLRHPDGSLDEGTVVSVGRDGTATLELCRPGYLYAYANDSWLGYGRNRGAATLTVTRS